MRNEQLQVGLPPHIMEWFKNRAAVRSQPIAVVARDVLVEYYNQALIAQQQQVEGNGQVKSGA